MAGEVWRNRVRHVVDGEPVDAATASRPARDEELRGNYLKARIDSAELGEGTVARGVTVAPSVLVDQPVFFNRSAGRFEQALAAVEVDSASGSIVPRQSADCLGIVLSKANATLADVLLLGRAATSLANAVDGTADPGRYYLSASVPGKLVRQRPPVGVPVLFYDGEYAYLAPQLHSFMESHVHYRFELACRPCGSDAVGSRVTIPSPDATAKGWLPATHASLSGLAPTGAAFGYNLAAHPELARVFPPLPLGSAVVVWDKGSGHAGGTLPPLGLDGLVHVDQNGIWWMSNVAGDVPWPSPYDASAPPADVPANSSGGPESPRLEEMRLVLSYTEMLFSTAGSVVTELHPAANSPITVTDCNGQGASSGRLYLDLDLTFLESSTLIDGDVAFKQLDGRTFRKGYVAEGLVAGANVTLNGTRQKNVGTTDAPVILHQGRVAVDVQTDFSERELPPQVARLYDARERYLETLNVLYYALPAARASYIRFELYVPSSGLPPGATVRVRALVYGSSAGTLPALTATLKRLPRPVSGTPVTLATPAEQSLTFDSHLAVGAGQYVEVESSSVSVTAGDTVLVAVRRAAGDGYSGEVGLIRLVGVIGAA